MAPQESSDGRKMAREVSSAYTKRGELTRAEIVKARERYERSAARYAERVCEWAEGWIAELESDGKSSQVPPQIKATILRNIRDVPEDQRTTFVDAGLRHSSMEGTDVDWQVKLAAAAAIAHVPPQDRARLMQELVVAIRSGLPNEWVADFRANAACALDYIPEAERAALIRFGIEKNPFSPFGSLVQRIALAPTHERAALVHLQISRFPNHIAGYEAIASVPKEERGDLNDQLAAWIADQFYSQSEDYYVRVARLIDLLPSGCQEPARKKLMSLFDSPTARLRHIKLISMAPQRERPTLQARAVEDIQAEIEQGHWSYVFKAVHLPEAYRDQLFALTRRLNVQSAHPLGTPLYAELGGDRAFGRANFNKEGSRTTLLGNAPLLGGRRAERHGAVIVRHITLAAFDAWRKAFEAEAFWKERGFDYVPIEPIISWAAVRGKDEVRVMTSVLGPNLEHWLENSGWKFRDELMARAEAIRNALKELHVVHGHIHDRNLCLVFPRKPNGIVDSEKLPRIFAIDFDAAAQL